MAMLTFEVLETWVEEFKTMNLEVSEGTKVIVRDAEEGGDTGLVGVQLQHASTTAYLEQEPGETGRWLATFESRDAPVVQDAAELLELSQEIATIAALCAFLQAKTSEAPAEEADQAA